MNISFHKAWKLSASYDERQILTELESSLHIGGGVGVHFGTSLGALCSCYEN